MTCPDTDDKQRAELSFKNTLSYSLLLSLPCYGLQKYSHGNKEREWHLDNTERLAEAMLAYYAVNTYLLVNQSAEMADALGKLIYPK